MPTAPKGSQPATVHSIEFARAHSTLKKTPVHRRKKCLELLHEQAQLVDRLCTIRSMLDALSDTDRPLMPTGGAKLLKLASKPSTVPGRV